jgi:hypothetical protein
MDMLLDLDPARGPAAVLRSLLSRWLPPSAADVAAAVRAAHDMRMGAHCGTSAALLARGEELLARRLGVASMKLTPLSAALSEYAAAAVVLAKGFERMASLCSGSGAAGLVRKQAAADAGALASIVGGMRAHAALEGVQEWGCLTLFNICSGADTAGVARRQAAADAGALASIAGGMHVHALRRAGWSGSISCSGWTGPPPGEPRGSRRSASSRASKASRQIRTGGMNCWSILRGNGWPQGATDRSIVS